MTLEIKEAIKEIIRTALFAVLPIIISELQSYKIDWKVIGVSAAIALLSGLDKYLHKSNIGIDSNGLTGV